MTAHATDYTWFEQRYPVLGEAYCLAQVQGISADELLRRFDALPGGEVTGLDAVVAAWESFDDGEDEQAEALFPSDEDRLFVAVTELDGWALGVEPFGYLGALDEVVPRLGEGTRLVAHFRNSMGVDHFHWWEHGIRRLHFEPLFPDQRDGSDAEAPGIPELLTACGFDLETQAHDLHTEAAFALAERLTDLRLGPERLEAATFRIGYAPRP
ncbi:DUF6461 domain-containing protein [Kitasatospora brasiliensis]|uniref:DUF6461 domain-containing protein n=1 Tax=Kitasatospora brasiliensis TaxID=3058040 RepID=UPI002931E327|nr:DUF6461 domain-containing protein [Kitasatospora sp. K002]